MTGTTHTSADLDTRRRRIMFRAWHRGMREMDLVFGGFCDAMIRDLNDVELDELETLMAENDQDLFKWIMGERPVPAEHDTAIYRRILAHRDQMTF
ncbi:succinate dehydrogenase assembly factor 2 [Zhengella mangrovi]|uniref:FAD assembly factor SdhE n=1 Tax=Zhengella mangrovi TaxID=1982044 RepID=A0A2G1QJQ8_9HYPH|nr:succinate dehydrogenase assembly factor 2 [Zhengella mangrovi]PHP65765.1 succinate dehydrogenase assembly factor 2 [Zhengella mangrovi]